MLAILLSMITILKSLDIRIKPYESRDEKAFKELYSQNVIKPNKEKTRDFIVKHDIWDLSDNDLEEYMKLLEIENRDFDVLRFTFGIEDEKNTAIFSDTYREKINQNRFEIASEIYNNETGNDLRQDIDSLKSKNKFAYFFDWFNRVEIQ